MRKETVFILLGKDAEEVARRVGCSKQAVYKWPDPLPRRIADRILAACVRMRAEKLRKRGKRLHPVELDAVS